MHGSIYSRNDLFAMDRRKDVRIFLTRQKRTAKVIGFVCILAIVQLALAVGIVDIFKTSHERKQLWREEQIKKDEPVTMLPISIVTYDLCGLESVICEGEENLKIVLEQHRFVTSYTSSVEETDSTPCIAATGKDICVLFEKGENICAANFVPLGTKLSIRLRDEGRPPFICTVLDRMNKRYKAEVDLYFGHDKIAARNFGRQKLLVSIIK